MPCSRGRHGEGIHLIVSSDIDASPSHNAGGAVVMCPRHQFIWPAAIVNNGSSVSITTAQPLLHSRLTALSADHPLNDVTVTMSRADKRITAAISASIPNPTAGVRRRIGRRNAQS